MSGKRCTPPRFLVPASLSGGRRAKATGVIQCLFQRGYWVVHDAVEVGFPGSGEVMLLLRV
jgi:hypothetical protein